MSLFAVQYTYSNDTARLDEHRPRHRAFLGALSDEGVVLASGPLGPGNDGTDGALMIMRADEAVALASLLVDDPFQKEGLVTAVDIRAWNPVLGARRDALAG